MFGDLFGGGDDAPSRPILGPDDFKDAENWANRLVKPTAAELEMLRKLGISADQADARMLAELRALTARGEDLANVDQDYMTRAYQPAFERLMTDYGNLDQQILENMNARGIASIPGGMSEPEAYQRSLLARDTKRTMAQTMLEAQNQAVQQKLARYNARLAEPTFAGQRYEQTMTPYRNLVGVPASERMQTKAGAAGNIYNAKLGYAANMHNINTQRMMQNKENTMNIIGAGLGVLGSGIGALASREEMKENIEPGPSPEQDLAEMTEVPVNRWSYRWEDESEPTHEGPMAEDMPEDTQVPGGIDVASYLGKLTNSVKALNDKMSAYERLLQGGVAHGF